MFNPFVRFQKRLIPAFRGTKERYLVSQTFTRENNLYKDPNKNYLLLSEYNDLGLAKIHYNAVANDKFATILDLENDKHREKLEEMLAPDSKYIIYSSLVGDPKKAKDALDKSLKGKMQKYLTMHTNWRIGKDEEILPNLEVTFGELYVWVRFGNQKVRDKLSVIENI